MVRTIARALAQSGIETHIATTDDNGPTRLDVPCGGPTIEDGVTYWYFRRQSRFYKFSWPLTTWLARNIGTFDIVHIHALFSYAAAPAAFCAQRSHVPYLVRPLGTLNRWGMMHRRPGLKQVSFRLIETPILRDASLIHFTSEQERSEAMDLAIRTPSVVIPNPLPSSPAACPRGAFREKYPQLADRRILLFLSRFDRKKGLDLLLEAFAKVHAKAPDVALVLAGGGDPSFIAELRAQAERLGVASDVFWPGFLEGPRKWAALADADLFVLPSYSENFGIAVVEAMAAGLPVVVSDQVGIHREIAGAQAGAVVPCAPAELAGALLHLLQDPPMRIAMGRNGKCLAQTQFSIENVGRKLIAAYNGLLN
jgi:glycosyltransferase involved in cell wall biosynthesis